MRLDKYLKVSRIIKRRTVAKEVADKGRIKVNGILAKSSTDLKINDQVLRHFIHDCIVSFLRKQDYMAKCHIGTSLFLLIY